MNIDGGDSMSDEAKAFETKVILQALADITSKADTVEEVYESIQKMANVEGLLLKPYSEVKKKK